MDAKGGFPPLLHGRFWLLVVRKGYVMLADGVMLSSSMK